MEYDVETRKNLEQKYQEWSILYRMIPNDVNNSINEK